MLKLLKVSGDSLLPEYQEGDFVLVSRIPFLFAPPMPGDTVAFRQPGYGTLVKKVASVTAGGRELTVVGTHPHSVDSRRFGAVSLGAVMGKVIWHIKK